MTRILNRFLYLRFSMDYRSCCARHDLAAVGSAYETSLCEYRVNNQDIRKTWSLNILSSKRFNVGDHYTSLVGDVCGLKKSVTCKTLEINYIAQN